MAETAAESRGGLYTVAMEGVCVGGMGAEVGGKTVDAAKVSAGNNPWVA